MVNSEAPDKIALSIIRRETHKKSKSEDKLSNDHVPAVVQDGTAGLNGTGMEKIKKPLSFNLAFGGLAAALFVFQLDATALGIALPVSLLVSCSPKPFFWNCSPTPFILSVVTPSYHFTSLYVYSC